jgi:hypothetical protein
MPRAAIAQPATSADPKIKKPDVPYQGRAEVVSYVMDPEELMVHCSLDDVAESPACKKQPEVEPPTGCECCTSIRRS